MCTGSAPTSTAPTIAASTSPLLSARSASSRPCSPESCSADTTQLAPPHPYCRFTRFATTLGMSPSVVAASGPGRMLCRAASIRPRATAPILTSAKNSSSRRFNPKRHASASQPMPTNTAVRSNGMVFTCANAWCATSSVSTCCARAFSKSFGGNAEPCSGSRMSRMAPAAPFAVVPASLSTAHQKSRTSAPSPTRAATATMAQRTRRGSVTPGTAGVRPAVEDCSTSRCALFPPKPNALIAARRTVSVFHSLVSCAGTSGVPASAGFTSSRCRIAGRTPCSIAFNTLINPATPATGNKCPRFALSEPNATRGPPANTCAQLWISVASPTPVPVA